MERIRIDSRELRARARHRQQRDQRREEATAPIRFAPPPASPEVDDDLLARIDQLLGERAGDRRDEDDSTDC